MATRFMTEDKTLWILVNSDFSGTATVGYRLDEKGNPIVEHDHTYQWDVPGAMLLSGHVTSHSARCVDPHGAPIQGPELYPVPRHVVGRAVALANRAIATKKIIAFGESLTW